MAFSWSISQMIGNPPVLHHTHNQQNIQQTVLILEGGLLGFLFYGYVTQLRFCSTQVNYDRFQRHRSLQITSRSPLQIDFFSQLLISIPPAHSIATTIHSVVVGFFKF